MNLENIIVIGICLAAIAIITFYFYNKCNSQKQDVLALNKRCETIEMILTKPSPQNELSDVYYRNGGDFHGFIDPPTYQVNNLGTTPPINKSFVSKQPWERVINHNVEYCQEGILKSTQKTIPLMPQKLQKCEVQGLCDLQPLQLEASEAEIDEIVEDEINVVIEKEKEKSKKNSPYKK